MHRVVCFKTTLASVGWAEGGLAGATVKWADQAGRGPFARRADAALPMCVPFSALAVPGCAAALISCCTATSTVSPASHPSVCTLQVRGYDQQLVQPGSAASVPRTCATPADISMDTSRLQVGWRWPVTWPGDTSFGYVSCCCRVAGRQ